MREKIMVFFCDIRGTYYNCNEKQRRKKILNIMRLLETINKKLDCSKILFSFLTDDGDSSTILMCVDELKKICGSKLEFGKQFYSDGYIYNNKTYACKADIKGRKIENYVYELWDTYDVERVIFADDAVFYIKSAEFFFDKARIPFEYHIINAKNGLESVIFELDNLLNELSNNKKNNIKVYKDH